MFCSQQSIKNGQFQWSLCRFHSSRRWSSSRRRSSCWRRYRSWHCYQVSWCLLWVITMPDRGGLLELVSSQIKHFPLASAAVIWCWGSTDALLFSCFRRQNLGLPLSIQHVCWERMLINLHRLLSFGIVKLDSPRFYSRLQLLPENLALIGAVRSCVVPLAIFHLL